MMLMSDMVVVSGDAPAACALRYAVLRHIVISMPPRRTRRFSTLPLSHDTILSPPFYYRHFVSRLPPRRQRAACRYYIISRLLACRHRPAAMPR